MDTGLPKYSFPPGSTRGSRAVEVALVPRVRPGEVKLSGKASHETGKHGYSFLNKGAAFWPRARHVP